DDHECRLPHRAATGGRIRCSGESRGQKVRRAAELQVHRPLAALQFCEHPPQTGARNGDLMLLIDDLLLMPIDGMKFIFRTLARAAEEQYTDDAPVKERLLELQLRLDSGEINEEEYVEQEAQILRDLREIQNRKRQLARLDRE